jgi:hypothetical protein
LSTVDIIIGAMLKTGFEGPQAAVMYRTELPEVADDAIFETILSLVMTGLIQQAPRPCSCHLPASPL